MCTVHAAVADAATEVNLGSVQTCLGVAIESILVGHKDIVLGRSKWLCIMSIIMQLGWGRHRIGLGFRQRHPGR